MSGLDFFLIAFSLLSAFLAMIRGFTREIFTLIAWIGAIVAPIYLILNYRAEINQYIGSSTVEQAAFAGGVFVIVLVILTYVAIKLSNMLFDSQMSVLESSLGFVFGLARGLVVISILYIFFSALVPKKDHPKWITEARSLTLIQGTGQSLISLFPEEPYDIVAQFLDSVIKNKPVQKNNTTGDGSVQPQAPGSDDTVQNKKNLNQLLGTGR
ncbi:MAG: CvpA family protein [Pseudomonadota bacterium]